jgi:integrase
MGLTTRFVKTVSTPGWYLDGLGLYLQVSKTGTGSFVFRYELHGEQHYLGLGSRRDVSLAEARAAATDARKLKAQGIDPLEAKNAQRRALIAERAKAVTFKAVFEAYLDLHIGSFKNAKHRQQWRNSLATYVLPKIGDRIVADIGPADILRCIEPIWHSKHVTASRVLERVTRVMDYATTRQYRTGDNPAAHVVESLPKIRNGKAHHAALPYGEIPALVAKLRDTHTLAARSLEFLILTAARTGEVLGAQWDEIDLSAKTWTIPASRMKAAKEHRVPLSDRAMKILQGLDRSGARVFGLSDWTLRDLQRELAPNGSVHGMRSSFRDWAAERTNYPNHVVEQALAHTIPSAVEAAYRRGDLFLKRCRLMNSWAEFCGKPISTGAVTLLRTL